MNLLVLHEAFSPSTPRLLREAAALLSPQSVKIPVQLAENVAPITGGGPDQDKAVFASILQLANSGGLAVKVFLPACSTHGAVHGWATVASWCIWCHTTLLARVALHGAAACTTNSEYKCGITLKGPTPKPCCPCLPAGIAAADLALMSNKVRTQLLQALQQRQTPTPKDMPAGLLLPPLTATCWAAASWQEVCPGLTGHDGGARTAGRRGAAAAAGDKNYNGFDLCIGDGTVHEGRLAAAGLAPCKPKIPACVASGYRVPLLACSTVQSMVHPCLSAVLLVLGKHTPALFAHGCVLWPVPRLLALLLCADDIWGCLDIQAASPAEQAQLQQSQQEAATRLRHLMGAAAGCAKPVLSETGQAFIGGWSTPPNSLGGHWTPHNSVNLRTSRQGAGNSAAEVWPLSGGVGQLKSAGALHAHV